MFGRSAVALLLSASCMQVPSIAMAQDAAEAPSALGDIVVTARRQSESQMSVPVSIVAFSQEALTSRGIANAFDLNRAVPGLTVSGTQASTAMPSFSIRGRGTNFGAAGGSVEAYFSEVPLSSPFLEPALPVQFFDLENLQVLKGPQGTLFGRNTTGGAVLVVPKAPSSEFEGYARAQGGTYENLQVETALNIPIKPGFADLRVAGFYWKRNGYMKTIAGSTDSLTGQTLPAQNYMNQDVKEVRATLRLRPFGILENSTILTYHYDKNRSSPGAGLNLFDSDGMGTFAGIEPTSGFPIYRSFGYNRRSHYVSVNLDKPAATAWAVINTSTLDLSSDVKFKNIFGYIYARGTGAAPNDLDGALFNGSDTLRPPRKNVNRQITDEVQLQGESFDHALNWTVGGLIDLTRQPGGLRSNFGDYSVTGGIYSSVFAQTRVTSKSLYAAGSMSVTNRIKISAGFRRSWDSFFSVEQKFGDPDPAVGLQSRPILDSITNPIRTFQKKFKGDTYNLGIDYQSGSESLVYASYRHGYKRGGISVGSSAGFMPETVDNFNLGWKQKFALGDVRGKISVEGYYDFYYNQQTSYFGPDALGVISTITTNVPRTIYRGLDLELNLEPSHWLSVSGAFSLTDAYNKKWLDNSLPGSTQDLSVNPVPYASKYKTSLTARFHGDLPGNLGEIAVAPSINYQSRFCTNALTSRLPLVEAALLGSNFDSISVNSGYVPGYTTADLRIEWNRILGYKLDGAINITNINNKLYMMDEVGVLYFNIDGHVYAPPRMATIEFKVQF